MQHENITGKRGTCVVDEVCQNTLGRRKIQQIQEEKHKHDDVKSENVPHLLRG